MTDPTTQHLYIMENEYGCIKIGRSVDPWQRRLNLRHSERCLVELVAAFEGGGQDEEGVHFELDAFRLEGEWFNGTDAARKAVARTFALDTIEWRFEYNPVGAAMWLDHLRLLRQSTYIKNAISRQIGALRTTYNPNWIHDGGVFWCRYLAETGNALMLLTDRKNGQTVNAWINPETRKREILPAYTASVELALLAWPADIRPSSWEGTAIDCCIAALIAIRSRLPKIPRPQEEA